MMAKTLKKQQPLTPTKLTTKDALGLTDMLMDVDSTDSLFTNKRHSDTVHSPKLSSSSSSNKYRFNSSTVMSSNSITIPADANQQAFSSLYPTLLKAAATQKNTTTTINSSSLPSSSSSSHPKEMNLEPSLEVHYAASDYPAEATHQNGTIPAVNTNKITDRNGSVAPPSSHVSSESIPKPTTTPPISNSQLPTTSRKGDERKPVMTKCFNCKTSTTPLWRRNPDGQALCNACGLFLKLHGVVRPLSLKSNVIKKRNRTNPNTIASATSANNSMASTNFICSNVGLTGVIGKRNNGSGIIQITPNNMDSLPIRTPSLNKRQRRNSQEMMDDSIIRSVDPFSSLPGLVIGSLPNDQPQHKNSLTSSPLHQHNYFKDDTSDNIIVGSAPALSWMGDEDQIQQQPSASSSVEPSLSQLTPDQLQQLVLQYQQQSIAHSGKELEGGSDFASSLAWNVFTNSP
ncbi:unnamed protein product [Absidia cylindrospora]